MKNKGVGIRLGAFLTSVMIYFSGCVTKDLFVKESNNANYGRSFKGGSITYSFGPDAKDHMNNTVMLRRHQLSRKGKLLRVLNEEDIHALYKDADVDENRYITKEEAENFYHMYSKMIEGRIKKVVPKRYKDAYKRKYEQEDNFRKR